MIDCVLLQNKVCYFITLLLVLFKFNCRGRVTIKCDGTDMAIAQEALVKSSF